MKSILGQLLNGRYFVVRQLQQTSSHIAYLADDQHKLDLSQCLVKQYKLSIPKFVSNVQTNKKFKSFLFKEISQIRQCDRHDQILQILDYFIWGDELYIIRQYLHGETIEEKITHRTLEESAVFHLLQETLLILETIHQAKQMHLNLKPSNIILAAGSQKVFLADSARLSNFLRNSIVKSQVIEATSKEDNYYLPPEQKSGKPEISSDFYALGAIAIQALTGKYPHQIRLCNLDNYARASLVDRETAQTINISSQLARILHDLTKTNPASRYQSAQEILAKLKQSKNVVLLPSPSTIFERYENAEEPVKINKPVKRSRQKNKFLPFIVAGITSIALSLAIAGYFFGRKNDPYDKFVEYQNPNHNISLKYPQKWTATELEDPITGEVVVLTSPLKDESDTFQEKIYLSINTYSEGEEQSKKAIINKMIDKIENTSGVTNISYQKQVPKLAQRATQSITYQRKQDDLVLQQKEIFTIRKGKIYLITYIAEKDRYQDFIKTVNRIIESFTLIEN